MLDLNKIEKDAEAEISKIKDLKSLEQFRIKHLGRKAPLSQFLRVVKDLSPQERAKIGKLANDTRIKMEMEIEKRRLELEEAEVTAKIAKEKVDVSAPGKKIEGGHLHPITLVQREVVSIFSSMGFQVIDGPEVETEWYNFDALNVPPDHPARDMQDTFWLKQNESEIKDPKKRLLPRTHTSPVQIRYMEKHMPPLRIIVPGRTFRNEATDATHEMQFYQFEGLMVDDKVSLANLKGVLEYFLKNFFKKEIKIKFVQSYFPFTEPSVEVMMRLDGNSRISGQWLEIAGAGMVHQNVFKAAGYAPGQFQGFAFGMTMDRLAMLKYGIDDIRLLYGSDLRFLEQF